MDIKHIGNKSIGIMYMTFGQTAAKCARESMTSLQLLGIRIPTVSVGDCPVQGTEFIKWQGKSPFVEGDVAGKFYAGEVKPFLYELSPFDYTLYIDADTKFMKTPMPGFQLLEKYDMALWRSEYPNFVTLQIIQDMDPRLGFSQKCADDCINEFGIEYCGIICSGIIFFRKNPEVKILMATWYTEWLKYKAWDEQSPLIRAMYFQRDRVRIKSLGYEWNNRHIRPESVINHLWGTGVARPKDDPHPSQAFGITV
jgi:hypothetical protein